MLAFTFPGQGSQRPGMGASWVDHPSFELVDMASEIAGRDVAELLLEADEETLRRTHERAARDVRLEPGRPRRRRAARPRARRPAPATASASTRALVAAGSLGFEDGLRLVAERGAAMQDAADERRRDDDGRARPRRRRRRGGLRACRGRRLGRQLQRARPGRHRRRRRPRSTRGRDREVSSARSGCSRFPVGGAFHTPLMAPARDRLRKALAEVDVPRAGPARRRQRRRPAPHRSRATGRGCCRPSCAARCAGARASRRSPELGCRPSSSSARAAC